MSNEEIMTLNFSRIYKQNFIIMKKELKKLVKVNKEELVFVNGGSFASVPESRRQDSTHSDSKKHDDFTKMPV